MRIRVIVHKAEEGGFWAEVPSIPGCATQGETMTEIGANVREAIEGCLSADPLFRRVEASALTEGLTFQVHVEEGSRAVVGARIKAASEPFRLRDGSFREGQGLQTDLKWTDLTTLAFQDEGGSIRP